MPFKLNPITGKLDYYVAGASQLSELSDVDNAVQTDGFVLKSDGTNYFGGQLSHTKLSDIGTKTHAQIEGHIQGIGNYAFPAADGLVDQILETNGAGALSWADPGGGGGVFEEVASVVRQASPGYDEDFVFGSPQLDDDGNVAHDARFFFDKSKYAFRVGLVADDQWDEANIGDYSFAGGYNNKASGSRSGILVGDTNIASGNSSAVVAGNDNIASGSRSAVLTGFQNQATAQYAGVLSGYNNQAKNWYSGIVTGSGNTINGPGSTNGRYSGILAGSDNTVSANYSAVITGSRCTVGGVGSAVIGGSLNIVNGTYATCLGGRQNYVHGSYSVGCGRNMQMTAAATGSFVFGYHTSAVSIPTPDAFLVFPSGTLGNMGLGTKVFGTNANAAFGIGNGAAPSSSPANMVQLYAEDVGGSSELKVRDEAGNISTLSPHSFGGLFEKPDPMAWSYRSKNPYIGKEIEVDMWSMVKAVENLAKQTFIYTAELPLEQVEDKEAELREVAIFEKMQDWVEITLSEAIEQIPVMETVEIGTKIVYELNQETGKLETVEKPDFEEQPTGKMEHKIQKHAKLDMDTGLAYRRKTRKDAELEVVAK